MRILFISAYYPPHVIGGWEQLVHDINVRLQARGHTTYVLTSMHGVESPLCEDGVDRSLSLENDLYHYKPTQFFVGRKHRLQANLAHTEKVIKTFKPDIIFIHGMWNLSKRIPWLAEKLCPTRIVYYMASDWPYAPDVHAAYWRDPAQKLALKLPKRLVAAVSLNMMARERKTYPLQFQRVLCVSKTVMESLARQASIPLARMRVVYMSVETERFVPPSDRIDKPGVQRKLAFLFAGSVVPHKGVHTAIEAMAILAHKPGGPKATLTIVGGGHPDYIARLKKRVETAGLTDFVTFQSHVQRDAMPALLQKFDGLVFPTITEEPLARMTMEAMATGLVVVGTTTGGTKEILFEGETGLTFKPEDAVALAHQIERLSNDPDLRARLAQNARELMLRNFDLQRMVDEIEAYLSQVVQNDTQNQPEPQPTFSF